MIRRNANGVPQLTYYNYILSDGDSSIISVIDSTLLLKSIGPFLLLHRVLLSKLMLSKPKSFHRCFCSGQEILETSCIIKEPGVSR